MNQPVSNLPADAADDATFAPTFAPRAMMELAEPGITQSRLRAAQATARTWMRDSIQSVHDSLRCAQHNGNLAAFQIELEFAALIAAGRGQRTKAELFVFFLRQIEKQKEKL